MNFLRITILKTLLFLKHNLLYLILIFLILVGECFAHELENKEMAALWSNNLRILSCLTMGASYFQMQKHDFACVQKLFLISILLPIIISLSSYLIPERHAIVINIGVNIVILGLWIRIFKLLGASIIFKDQNNTFSKLIPAFFILPLLFYYFSLYQSLTIIFAILVLIYILVFSYTGLLAAFLPINEEKVLWIIFGIILLVLVNMMNGYHTFMQKISNAYPIIRTMTVISRCMIIYGMIGYVEEKIVVFEED